jgi:predicted metal-dependent enzyme (double-stranded beta helix superfamily)
MFTVDQFVADCVVAATEPEPRLAIREVMRKAFERPGVIRDALPASRAELVVLHRSPNLTVVNAVWAPGMRIRPHNHLMWAAIGLYAGQEDNLFYRRTETSVTTSGCRQLHEGDVALLGDDTIHSVHNPRSRLTGAIHVYGGDLVGRPDRSEWDGDQEVPFDFDAARQRFEDANAAMAAANS